jgi:lipid-A-disaccharide synthase
MTDCFIVTGEASGDAVGAGVAQCLQAARPEITVSGIGAARMQDAGVRLWANSRDWAAMGIVQSIPVGFRLLSLLRRLKEHLLADKPKVLVLIDFGTFNMRLGRWAVANGIATAYLMPPGSWRKTVGGKPIQRLAGAANLFLCPFKWNADNLKTAGANAVHIGHPVLDLAMPTTYAPELAAQMRLEGGRLIALLPGSRRHEVESLAPLLIDAAYKWPYPADRFVMVQAPTFTDAEFTNILRKSLPEGWHEEAKRHNKAIQEFMAGRRGEDLDDDAREELETVMRQYRPRFTIVDGGTTDALHACDLAIVCGGTATLEAAVALKPMVVVYNGSWMMSMEWKIRKRRLKAPFIAMPNIIAGSEIVRELVDDAATVPNIVAALRELVDDAVKYAVTVRTLEKVRDELRPAGAIKTAAAKILELM